MTINVVIMVSFLEGQVTLETSFLTCWINSIGPVLFIFWSLKFKYWQEWRESNPQPPVLETGALANWATLLQKNYSTIFETTPAPTVLPPSRIANLRLSSIAIGTINSTSISTLSPGITISVPLSNWQTPVTSVVLK